MHTIAATWIDMLLQHYQDKHVLILLKDLVTRHVRAKGDDAAKIIVTPLNTRFTNSPNISNYGKILTSVQYFLQLLDLLKVEEEIYCNAIKQFYIIQNKYIRYCYYCNCF